MFLANIQTVPLLFNHQNNSPNHLSSLTFHPTKQLNQDATHGWRGFPPSPRSKSTLIFTLWPQKLITLAPICKRVLKTKHSEVPQRNGTPLNIFLYLIKILVGNRLDKHFTKLVLHHSFRSTSFSLTKMPTASFIVLKESEHSCPILQLRI